MFGGLIGTGDLGGSNQPIISQTGVKPWYTGSGGTKTVTDPATGQTTTVSIKGYTPTTCNEVPDKSGGQGSAQNCCAATKGFWYQDYGLFAPLFPDKSFEYCHEKPIEPLQVPLNQGLVIGVSALAVVGLIAYKMMKRSG